MRLLTFVKIMGFITLLSLVYINMQMQIFDLAYMGKDKQKKIDLLVKEKEHLTNAIFKLKSANNLGLEMFDEDSNMDFVDPQNIVHISAAPETDQLTPGSISQLSKGNNKSFISFLSFASKAEAKIRD